MTPQNTRLDSWKAIAAYLGRDVSTVVRWEKDKGLPVHRVPGGRRQAIFALTAEIDAWLVGQPIGSDVTRGPDRAAGPADDPGAASPPVESAAVRPAPGRLTRAAVAMTIAAAGLALVAWFSSTEARPTTARTASGVPAFERQDIQMPSPYSLAAGDLDSDGRLDFVVSAYRTNRLHAYLGRGDGTFEAAGEAATGIKPDGIVLGDFNGDGVADAATANRESHTVSIFLGAGGGTFGRRVDYDAGRAPRGLVAGDLDGDGAPDLAVAAFEGASVTPLLGRQGRLETAASYAVGTNPYQVRLADLNGDGLPDLVAGNTDEQPPDGAGTEPFTLTVLLGAGGGQFRTHARYRLGNGSSGIAVADVDRDGRPDLAVTSFEDDVVFILRGRGDGTFGEAAAVPTGAAPLDIVAVDVDGDGVVDLATANAHDKSVSILRGRGDGTFEPRVDVGVNSYPKSIVAGDFDADGAVDFVVSNFLDNSISVLLARR